MVLVLFMYPCYICYDVRPKIKSKPDSQDTCQAIFLLDRFVWPAFASISKRGIKYSRQTCNVCFHGSHTLFGCMPNYVITCCEDQNIVQTIATSLLSTVPIKTITIDQVFRTIHLYPITIHRLAAHFLPLPPPYVALDSMLLAPYTLHSPVSPS